MYYNGDKILNNPQPFNFLLGNRGTGKSFYWKRYLLRKYIAQKKQFIYVRRYKSDLDKIIPTLFDDVSLKFKDYEIKTDKNQVYINGEVAGWCIAVSEFIKYKSSSFPDVETIMFDEFLPEDGKYLGGKTNPTLEPELCLNFYQTVARGYNRPIRDEVLFIFISNSVTINNPYFYFYNIDKKLNHDTKFYRGQGFNVEINRNVSIANEISDSKFGQLIKGTKYEEYALGNEFYLDSKEFIEDLAGNKRYIFTFVYDNMSFGLWINKDGMYYLTDVVDKNCKNIYSLTTKDHNGNSILITSLNSYIFKQLRSAYAYGKIRFANQRCKNFFETVINKR